MDGEEKLVLMMEDRGAAGGVASLDETGKVPKEQLPDSAYNSDLFAYALYKYDGVDLTAKFASEIAEYGDVWAWLKARLEAQDISGLHIKDFIPVTTTNGYTLICQIADINHDLGYMDTEITQFHIDFISKDLWPEAHRWNRVNYNNGISAEPCPWMCSDLYAWLNSKKMAVPNAATVNPATVTVDYTTTGVFDKLPAALQSVIVERRGLEPSRFSSGGLLTDDVSFAWRDIGKLWVPDEVEAYGHVACGSRIFSIGASHQFPIFLDGKTRIKHMGSGGNRGATWLRSVRSGASASAANIDSSGPADYHDTTNAGIGAPVCFRVSG